MNASPTTPEEWQFAVDAAEALLQIDSARQYGLIEGGPVVVVERCVALLERGKQLGHVPAADAVERFVAGWNASKEGPCLSSVSSKPNRPGRKAEPGK